MEQQPGSGVRELYAEQRRVRARLWRALEWFVIGATLINGLLGIGWMGYRVYRETVWLPGVLTDSRGSSLAELRARLGKPMEEYPAGSFACVRGYPCDPANARGRVQFFFGGLTGYGCYAYFDSADRLIEHECTGS